ncbi:NADH-quinone oxidoreductase subunit B family protein [Curtanaerobium respiraculi]|uniref:NADH-quinone oxidoreductase subunit B family protein n=1 Tax=Curtanaerobium respiraculi TaxID=2949669 RepID=UPI0024B333B3|nr:NADH-quinone oxidoreductase subunit B family protein [Curtanaerobium respiraculi]
MIIDHRVSERLQYRPDKITLDESVQAAKQALLNDIKRSVYIYRCDLGGCNGCEIEIFATITPVFDAERFGIKNTPSPRHADVLVYTGAVTRAMRMPGLRAYHAAPDPKLVVSYGACGCTGGIFHDNYCVWGGTDKVIPVDVYIPGCPPTPAQTVYGFALVLGLLGQKLHHSDTVEEPGVKATLRFSDVPYKVRTAIERKARLYSGYRYGQDLSDIFLETLEKDGSVYANLNELIVRESDPRKVEVYRTLRDDLMAMAVGPEKENELLREGLRRIVPPGTMPGENAQAILDAAER